MSGPEHGLWLILMHLSWRCCCAHVIPGVRLQMPRALFRVLLYLSSRFASHAMPYVGCTTSFHAVCGAGSGAVGQANQQHT